MDCFPDKLQQLLSHFELSASQFADKINVQRSVISHILSERNKPSLSFILKIVSTFESVNLYWLVKNEGDMLLTQPSPNSVSKQVSSLYDKNISNQNNEDCNNEKKKTIERVIIFYSDKTMDVYNS